MIRDRNPLHWRTLALAALAWLAALVLVLSILWGVAR